MPYNPELIDKVDPLSRYVNDDDIWENHKIIVNFNFNSYLRNKIIFSSLLFLVSLLFISKKFNHFKF